MFSLIVSDPTILSSTPVSDGTRVPADCLFDYLKRGNTLDFFLEQFPTVRRGQAEQALEMAKDAVVSGRVPA